MNLLQNTISRNSFARKRNARIPEQAHGYPPQACIFITALQVAVEKGDRTLDKEATSHDDLFDSFRLSLTFWH